MIYYTNGNDLFSSETPINGEAFVEISESEYAERLESATANREQGTPAADSNDDFIIGFSGAAESDYISALEDLGVQFDG